MLVIVGLAFGARYVFMRPLRRRIAELTETDNSVFCVTLDPLWMPPENTFSGTLGIGYLIVSREGIRIVDDTNREILVAAWAEVVDVRPNRAPKAIAELVLNRGGEITQSWFYVLGPRTFLRRGRRGISRFVRQVRALRPEVPA
jgi:hypothetical protein